MRGLFAGGTLCSEAQIIFGQAGLRWCPMCRCRAHPRWPARDGHVMIDLGDDEFTRGRPHPMFEPGVRDAPLAEALADPRVGLILLDVVLGYGGHLDPAGHLAAFLAGGTAARSSWRLSPAPMRTRSRATPRSRSLSRLA